MSVSDVLKCEIRHRNNSKSIAGCYFACNHRTAIIQIYPSTTKTQGNFYHHVHDHHWPGLWILKYADRTFSHIRQSANVSINRELTSMSSLICGLSGPLLSFLPERDYVTFGFLLSQIRLSSVTFVHPTQGVKTFRNISSPLCTLAILWPLCKIL